MFTPFWAGNKSFQLPSYALCPLIDSCMQSGDIASGRLCELCWSHEAEGAWAPGWWHGSRPSIHPHCTVMWVSNKPLLLSHLSSVAVCHGSYPVQTNPPIQKSCQGSAWPLHALLVWIISVLWLLPSLLNYYDSLRTGLPGSNFSSSILPCMRTEDKCF